MTDVVIALLLFRHRHQMLSLHRGIDLILTWERLLQFGSPALQYERNGQTGVLPLPDEGSGCGDINREFCEAR